MQMNQAGYDLLKSFEECRLIPYEDEGGVWTIAWGHVGPQPSQDGGPWSQDEADQIYAAPWTQAKADNTLVTDVQTTVDDLLDMIDPELSDNQFSALVCMAFNIGSHAFEGSSALLLVNEGRLADVSAAMMKWVKVRINGVLHVSRGLVRRRRSEVALWNLA